MTHKHHVQGYLIFAYLRYDGLGATVIAPNGYPQRVAFQMMTDVLSKFTTDVP